MDKFNCIIFITAGSLLFSGCSFKQGWTPTIDTYNKSNAYSLNQDLTDCRAKAVQVSDQNIQQVSSQTTFRNALRSCLRQRGQTVIN